MPTPAHVNRFIRAVAPANRKSFLLDCDTVQLEYLQKLAETDGDLAYAYFPTTALISQLAQQSATSGLEVALAGDEGMVGATLALGIGKSPLLVVVQGAGSSLRMGAADFVRHIARNPRLEELLRSYLYVQMVQLSRAAVCSRFHVVKQRLARWLLMMQDRTHSDEFHMTQELLASMLGVRRVGVTTAAGALQDAQLISYRRGEIRVLDRLGLEQASCSCYAADRGTYAAHAGEK